MKKISEGTAAWGFREALNSKMIDIRWPDTRFAQPRPAWHFYAGWILWSADIWISGVPIIKCLVAANVLAWGAIYLALR